MRGMVRAEVPPRRNVAAVRLTAVDGDAAREVGDRSAAEEPMEIRAGGPGHEAEAVAVTMRTPGSDFELAAGFLFTEGLVASREEIATIAYCELPAAVRLHRHRVRRRRRARRRQRLGRARAAQGADDRRRRAAGRGAGMEIGSHSLTHRAAAGRRADATLADEVRTQPARSSRDLTGRTSTGFCYPYGAARRPRGRRRCGRPATTTPARWTRRPARRPARAAAHLRRRPGHRAAPVRQVARHGDRRGPYAAGGAR